jgi:type IV secretory pathway VirB10-like protein
MRLGVILSLGLHMLVVAMTWFGLPHLRRDPPLLDDIIFVKVTEIAEVTNVPPVSESKKPKQKQIAKPKVPRNKPKVPILQKKRILKKEQIIPKTNKKSPETVPKPRRKKKDSVLAEISKPKKKPSQSREKSQAKKKQKPSERPMKKKIHELIKGFEGRKIKSIG